MIYLDNAATTPLCDQAIVAMNQVMKTIYGNPSSLHHLGREASKLLRANRKVIADCLHTQPDRIIFTSGGTEGNNLAIKGYALAHQDKGRHIISSQMEHHAVLEVLAYLEKRFGFEVTLLPPSENGSITPEQVAAALREDTILVSLMWANNETGHINPIAAIGQVLAHHQAAFHVDAVQVAGKLELNPEACGIDFLSASAHKFHGPKGVGFLYAGRKDFDALFHGGDQEDHSRASTENLIGIAGMAAALQLASENRSDNFQKVETLRQLLLEQLDDERFELNSPFTALPHVLSLRVVGVENDFLLTRLDLEGFAISSGSACTAGNIEPSHVLTALYGESSPRITQSIRVSLSSQTSVEDITAFATTLKRIVG